MVKPNPNTGRPMIAPGSHPIEVGEYCIGTPATYGVYTAVSDWLDRHVPGALVFGPPRFGKSRAVHHTSLTLAHELGESVQTVYIPCRFHKVVRETEFFEEMLTSFGHGFPRKGQVRDRRERVNMYLCGRADLSPQRRLILFFDDAQNLQTEHYQYLMDIYNELEQSRVRSLYVMVGQKELAARRDAMCRSRKYQIIGRFMLNAHQFSGLASVEHIEACLHAYDESTEFPVKSGWSYSRYYFPAAFESGWRLRTVAEDLWDAFMETRRTAKLPGPAEIPMIFFTGSVEYILRKFGSLDEEHPRISKRVAMEAVEKSGYALAGDFIDAEGVPASV